MRYALMLTMLAEFLAGQGDAPAKTEKLVVRPVLWWSDLKRVSDGGGAPLLSTITCVTDPKAFVKEWDRLGLKGTPPRINFKEYVAVVVFRVAGLDFEANGGLEVDPQGNAKVIGPDAFTILTNAGWYSTTIGVFPRRGISAIDGRKLPAGE